MAGENRVRGIQSIEIGYRVLVAIQAGPGPVPLKLIAERAGLAASAAHNYLVSLVRTGMVEAPTRGQYRLGPSLASFGLSALREIDFFDVVRDEAVALSDRTQRGVAVLTWSNAGTAIVYHREGARRGAFDLRNGPVSTLHTGGGNVFMAYLDPAETLPVVQKEAAAEGLSDKDARRKLDEIRRSVLAVGYAVCDLSELPGYRAISAPVWNSEDMVAYAITVTGPIGTIDPTPDGEQVQQLLASSQLLSRQLGASPARWHEPTEVD